MVSSIAYSLGYGSGLDVGKLVTDLAAASRDPKIARLDSRTKAVQTSISAVAQARSDLQSFASSLTNLVASGTLQSQPAVSDTSILEARTRNGSTIGTLAAEVEVVKVARGQTLASSPTGLATDSVGQGTLSLTMGTQSYLIMIDSSNDSAAGLAGAINASQSGVTANVVSDPAGARLVLKGPTGAASAFTLASRDPALSAFCYPGALSMVQSAVDAEVKVDGLTYFRPSNTIDDVVSGVTLSLKKAALGTPVGIGVTRAGETLKSTLADFVSVFNELKGHIAEARAAMRGDQGMRTLDRQLSQLVSLPVATGDPTNLAAIGIKTNRDGSLAFDQASFDKIYASTPSAVEAIFAPPRDATHTEATDPGIGKVLSTLEAAVVAPNGTLTSLTKRLGRDLTSLSDERARVEARETVYKARLERQFGNVDVRVGALKATQSYLDQQIKVWTASR